MASLQDIPRFTVFTAHCDGGRLFEVSLGKTLRSYRLKDTGQDSYLDFFAETARDFGLRSPLSRRPFEAPPAAAHLHPLLTRPVCSRILYGYGDPCMARAPDPQTGAEVWWLTCTSNDAPDAFPILRSEDLKTFTLQTFVFPHGHAPRWALTGQDKADFWAPEMHRVGDEYWVCFSARRLDRELAIGIAKAPTPTGPYVAHSQPLKAGGVIDPHLLIQEDGPPLLYWKEDSNGVWPRLLADLVAGQRHLIETLFAAPEDRLTASLAAALWSWAKGIEPMEQFFVLQPLIEAVTEDFQGCEARLIEIALREPNLATDVFAIRSAMKTKVYAQPLSEDGLRLEGEPKLVVENDQTWEAHLIEGVWVHKEGERYYLFYSGNDFSTHHYGIGAAVADHPLGPYVKGEPLLRSTSEWSGPGHPSVAPGPDGKPWLFLHAYAPGHTGYKAFRALLGAQLAFTPEGARLV